MSVPDRDLVAEERESARRAGPRFEDTPRTPGPAGSPRAGGARGVDEGTRRLALIAGGIGALLVATIGGWSLLGHRQAGIPIIEPLPGPIRVKPTDPGGMQVMSAQVAQTNGQQAQALAPGPETARPQDLQARVDAAKQADAPPASPATPSPVANAPAGVPAANAPGSGASDPGGPVPRSFASGSRPSAALPDAVPAPVAPRAGAAQTATPAPNGEPPATPAAPEADGPAAGAHAVQLAAVESEAAAKAEWAKLSHQAPVLASRTPVIVPVEHDGKRFFRLRTTGFATIAEATAFCGKLHASGIACTLADF